MLLKTKQDRNVVIAVVSVAAFILVSLIVFYCLQLNADNNKIEDTKQQIVDNYKQSNIDLDMAEIEVSADAGEVTITNEEKEREYIKQQNIKLNNIKNKYYNNSNNNQDDTQYNDIQFIIDDANIKQQATNDLYKYFDNSQFINMNTGKTYIEEWSDEVEKVHEQQQKIEEEQRRLHEDMTDEEFNEWYKANMSNFNVPSSPEYDESKEDINLDQLNKAFGFLTALGVIDNQLEKASLGHYIYLGEINNENIMDSYNFTNNHLFESFLTNNLFGNELPINSNYKVDEYMKSYEDGNLDSIAQIYNQDIRIVVGYDGNNYKILDIEKVI